MTQRLFAGVYLDEDVSVLVADVLNSRGFIVETARDAGTLGQTDKVQLEYAATNELALVTHNRRDFEALHHDYATRQQSHWGIVIAARRRPYEIARRLLRLLDAFTADELKDQLIYL